MQENLDIETQAADWLAQLDAEPESPAVRDRLELWLHTDPAHEAAFLRLQTVWGRLDRLAALRPAAGEPIDSELLAKLAPASLAARAPRARWFKYAIAAMVLITLASTGLFFSMRQPGSTYVTQVGERRHIQLEDSSILTLNTQSKAVVKYQPDRRRIELGDGEALFKVAKDPNRPFVVTARKFQIRAVGTEFSVRTRPGAVEVIVTEGTVDVSEIGTPGAGDGTQQLGKLTAGQTGVYGEGIQTVRNVNQQEVDRRLAWENGMIAFDGQTLSDALEEFNRYNTRKLVIADPAIGSLRVGGYFHTDDVNSFVSALAASFGIRTTEETGNTIYLIGPAKS